MADPLRIFISWSGPRSHEIALALREWLPAVVPGVEPWVSSEDIAKGAHWTVALAAELAAAKFGIICLVTENVGEPWLTFEAGAMSRSIETTRVAPLLVGVAVGDVPGPLRQFQCTVFEPDDVRLLVRSVNQALPTPGDQRALDEVFGQQWPNLRARVRLDGATPRPAAPARAQPTPARPEELNVKHPGDIAVLRLLAQNPHADYTASLIARAIRETPTRARYHIDRLKERGLIGYRNMANGTYTLTVNGRAFVVENDLDRQ